MTVLQFTKLQLFVYILIMISAICLDLMSAVCLHSPQRRYLKSHPHTNESAHLHKLSNKAVALCRTEKLTLFVFSLPNCQLLLQLQLMDHLPTPIEDYELDQRFLMKENTMIFMFHDKDFFADLFHQSHHQPQHEQNRVKKYGKLLFIDFEG